MIAEIGQGLLVFLCAEKGDADKDLDHLVKKVSQLRIFGDEQGKMNRSVMDVKGEVLVVSQFTLAASLRKGNRPSFEQAENPVRARRTVPSPLSGASKIRVLRSGPENSPHPWRSLS